MASSNDRSYYLGALLAAPLLPLMYWQGKRIRSSVPRLPEAEGTSGSVEPSVVQASNNSSRAVHLQDPAPVSQRPLRVIALGESTFAGVGVATHAEGFTGTFAKELATRVERPVDWRVYARSGYTAKRLTYKIVPKIAETEADLLIVGLGGNDAFKLNKPSQWRKDCAALIDALQERFTGTPIVFCQMPPIKEFPAFTSLIKFTVGGLVELLGRELVALVKTYEGVYALSDTITLKGWSERFGLDAVASDYFSDGVHPSKLTYQIWARDVARQIAEQDALQPLLRGGPIPQRH